MTFRSQDLKYLIDTHGKPLTLVVKGDLTYDPATGNTTGSETEYTVQTYFYNYNLSDIDGQNIRLGDRRVVLPLVDTFGNTIPEPETGDEISGEGDKVSIVRVAKIMSGLTAVCYMCQVRE
jgi:hypothetical protein